MRQRHPKEHTPPHPPHRKRAVEPRKKATARPRVPTPRKARSKTKTQSQTLTPVEQALELDRKESAARLKEKETQSKKTWGKEWRNFVRPGRKFTRVETIHPTTADGEITYVLRSEPGWEFNCSNCGTYSLVLESLVAHWKFSQRGQMEHYTTNLMEEWEELAKKTVERGFTPPPKPIASTAFCPNCRFKPGAPE